MTLSNASHGVMEAFRLEKTSKTCSVSYQPILAILSLKKTEPVQMMKLVLFHYLHPSCSYPSSCCPPAASYQHPLNSFHLFYRFPSGASSGSTANKRFWIFHYQGLSLKIWHWRVHIHCVQLFQRSTPGKPNLEWGNADFWMIWVLTHIWIHSAGFGSLFLNKRALQCWDWCYADVPES